VVCFVLVTCFLESLELLVEDANKLLPLGRCVKVPDFDGNHDVQVIRASHRRREGVQLFHFKIERDEGKEKKT